MFHLLGFHQVFSGISAGGSLDRSAPFLKICVPQGNVYFLHCFVLFSLVSFDSGRNRNLPWSFRAPARYNWILLLNFCLLLPIWSGVEVVFWIGVFRILWVKCDSHQLIFIKGNRKFMLQVRSFLRFSHLFIRIHRQWSAFFLMFVRLVSTGYRLRSVLDVWLIYSETTSVIPSFVRLACIGSSIWTIDNFNSSFCSFQPSYTENDLKVFFRFRKIFFDSVTVVFLQEYVEIFASGLERDPNGSILTERFCFWWVSFVHVSRTLFTKSLQCSSFDSKNAMEKLLAVKTLIQELSGYNKSKVSTVYKLSIK